MDHVSSASALDGNLTGTVGNFLRVTKPGILLGNLVSAAGGFLLASGGRADTGVLAATVIGISLVVASACVFNNCIDRSLDRKMVRTRNRVLARGLMSTKTAAIYASLLGISGIALLGSAANLLSLAVVLSGFAIYVGAYSLYLKRSSPYATLIGSLAGAAPPLAGYCAAGNGFDTGAAIVLLMFTLWQIPHSYSIAIYHFNDYAAAAIPVLPVKRGIRAAKRRIVISITAFATATLLPTICGYTGYGYLAAAATMGVVWLCAAGVGPVSDDKRWARKQFVYSIVIITVLSVMMSINATAPAVPGTFPLLGH